MHAPLTIDRPRASAPAPWLRATTLLIALAAMIGPAVIVRFAPRPIAHVHRHLTPPRVVPPTEVPPVEPVAVEDLAPDDARALNAAVPFTSDPVPAARPFRLEAAPVDRSRAIDCLAAAELYEAGDDATGERAVAQVVLNRLRHPAFPKTVCGVVFQGSERSTGCQFTFTCDGALQRHAWSGPAWARARLIAQAALNGAVYGKVGYATHYHTDWVVPYWSASLDKVAAVGSHLFFRWTGWWGTPGAFARSVGGAEPTVAALAPYSPAHQTGMPAGDLLTLEQRVALVNSAIAKLPPPLAGDNSSFLVTIDAAIPAADLARLAVHSCGERSYCKFMAWTRTAQTPKRLPLSSGQIATMAFSYFRDHDHFFDKMLWNCRVFSGIPKPQCMKAQTFQPTIPAADPSGPIAEPPVTDGPLASDVGNSSGR